MSAIWVVVPVRGILAGKSRLGSVLDGDQRAALNRRLLATTLDAVARWQGGLDRCIVVSPCGETLGAAREAGAVPLLEAPGRGGLNAAAAQGFEQAVSHGAASVLILACDLPTLTAAALEALAEQAGTDPRVVMAPDRRGTGTNALLLVAGARIDFRYGETSCAAHRESAGARDLPLTLCRHPELAFDLDTPADLAEWREHGQSTRRRAMRRML